MRRESNVEIRDEKHKTKFKLDEITVIILNLNESFLAVTKIKKKIITKLLLNNDASYVQLF